MDTFLTILKHPFTWGLLLGILILIFVLKNNITVKGHLKKEIKRLTEERNDLQKHLNTQLKINAAGNEALDKQVLELKEHNEILRMNLSTLQQKPGKQEAKQLHVTENAVRMMREQAPGFAPAWERALQQAESDYANAENGLQKIVRKILPSLGQTSNQTLEVKSKDSSGSDS